MKAKLSKLNVIKANIIANGTMQEECMNPICELILRDNACRGPSEIACDVCIFGLNHRDYEKIDKLLEIMELTNADATGDGRE